MDFEGVITFGTIELLLDRLRSSMEFQEMPKPVRKRLYSIFVESIDNIFKYAARQPSSGKHSGRLPKISIKRKGKYYVVRAGNLISNDDIGDLRFRIDRVNQLDNEALKSLYEDVINREAHDYDTGAGLGLITMAMRTDKDIEYSFTEVDNGHSFFEFQITLNG